MLSSNEIFATYTSEIDKNEFNIQELKEGVYNGLNVSFRSSNGHSGGESLIRSTKQSDFDIAFVELVLKLKPVNRIDDLLDFHLDSYEKTRNKNVTIFLKHIRYEILPRISKVGTSVHLELIKNWITKKESMDLQEQFNKKVNFLKKAYELAAEHSPSSPFSVGIKPVEFGKTIGLDKSETSRIVNELVNENFGTSTLGMSSFYVTQMGLNFLFINEQDNGGQSNSIIIGDNSQVQIQQNVTHSNQLLEISKNSENIKQLLGEIRTGLSEIKKHLETDDFSNLKEDIDYLENQLSRNKPNESTIKSTFKSIQSVLKPVPSKVISSLISKGLIELLKGATGTFL